MNVLPGDCTEAALSAVPMLIASLVLHTDVTAEPSLGADKQ